MSIFHGTAMSGRKRKRAAWRLDGQTEHKSRELLLERLNRRCLELEARVPIRKDNKRVVRPIGRTYALFCIAALLAGVVGGVLAENINVWLGVVTGEIALVGVHVYRLYRRSRTRHADQESAHLTYELKALPGGEHLNIASARVEKLLERVDRQERLLVQHLLRNVFLAMILGVPVFGVAVAASVNASLVGPSIATALFELLAAIGFVFARNRARELESEVQQTDYELNLLSKYPTGEQRAELLYLKQQFELKRYYDEALRQSTTLSYIGAACVVGGFVVIGVTFALLLSGSSDDDSRVVIAVIGGVGGVLANFVAVVFLRMHSGTIRALTEFQGRLVETNHLHFANLLLARIDAVRPRHASALAKFAKVMASNGNPSSRSQRQ